MRPLQDRSFTGGIIIQRIWNVLLFAVTAFAAAIAILLVGLFVLVFFRARYTGPIPSVVGLCGYSLIPLSLLGGLIAATPTPRAKLFTRRRIGVACLLVIGTALGIRHYVRSHDWAMIQRSTKMQESAEVSDLSMYEDPSFIHPCWIFAHFKIPPDRVDAFVNANGCEATDRTSLRRRRECIPQELQSVPATGKRFYKAGKTRADLGFDLLVDAGGNVLMFVLTPD